MFPVRESRQGEDLNGDGDTWDWVVHVRNLATGETTNLRLVGYTFLSEDWLVLRVYEGDKGEDLNGDGDTEDLVVHVHNLSTAETTNLRLAGSPGAPSAAVSRDWLVFYVFEPAQGEDLNGDGGTGDWVVHLVDLNRVGELRPSFRRGDCNNDGMVDISDAVFSLGSLFLGDGVPGCDDACDSNDDGTVDISDAIATLGVLFLGNGMIPLPGMEECGVDPTDDQIDCDTFELCP